MRPAAVVVIGVDAEDAFEVPAPEDQQPVEAFAADAADPALHMSVRVRCLDGRADHPDVRVPGESVEAAATPLAIVPSSVPAGMFGGVSGFMGDRQ